ncbi:MAG: holo-ACP synthase [Oscillospiraceae bacterium]|nr:holo-ACP synthase [Oscillospiraceae bacterium]
MTLQIGIDHLEISRIAKAMENPRFLPRYFGERELAYLARKKFPPASVAAGFCAKEAFAKALGTGIRGFALREIELLRAESGRPYLAFTGKAAALVEASGLRFEVSVSHDKHYALAQVIGYEGGDNHADSHRQ